MVFAFCQQLEQLPGRPGELLASPLVGSERHEQLARVVAFVAATLDIKLRHAPQQLLRRMLARPELEHVRRWVEPSGLQFRRPATEIAREPVVARRKADRVGADHRPPPERA